MKYIRLIPLLFLVIVSLLSPAAIAASVDGNPSLNDQTDSGLYVWRTSTGDWQVRLVSGNTNRQTFRGIFEASQSISIINRISTESSDSAWVSAAGDLTTKFDVYQGGTDGVSFSIAADADLCLRDSAGETVVVYLGAKRVRASTPVDLTGSGACSQTTNGGAGIVDGAPAYDKNTDSGMYVWRRSDGVWSVRLVSGNINRQQFGGAFVSNKTFNFVRHVELESGDVATVSGGLLTTELNVFQGGEDGLNISIASGAELCLTGSGADIYLGSNAVPAVTPVDLTGTGACGGSSGGTTSAPPPPPPVQTGRKYNVGHYVEFLRKSSDSKIMLNSVKEGVVGFVKRYTWRQLEPRKDVYDFAGIEEDLALVASQGLQLIILIEDKTFYKGNTGGPEQPLPAYLATSQNVQLNRVGGYTAARWSPTVVARWKALYTALGNRFDSHPNFEGVTTQETAPSLDKAELEATNYTPEKYRDALIDVLSHGTKVMPTSRIFWFMNFMPRNQGYLADVGNAVSSLGVVAGVLDVLPDDMPLTSRVYPILEGFSGKMPLFSRLEGSCYRHEHEDASYPTKYWTMRELFRYSRDQLDANYMLWVRITRANPSDSYTWTDALPVIANNPVFNQ